MTGIKIVALDKTDVARLVGACKLPLLEKDLETLKAVEAIELEGDQCVVKLCFGFPLDSLLGDLKTRIQQALQPLALSALDIQTRSQVQVHGGQPGLKPVDNIKNIIAVASGKGGVGKSTTAVNIALALAAEGATVGILDADIHGPSQPIMLGTEGQNPETKDQKSIEPVESHGLQSMSIGYLIEQDQAMIWRGPMVGKALQQIFGDTNWRDVDYLIMDLPPGTGDVQLTMAQKIPVSGAVIVTTPQDIALQDAVKAVTMFNKVNVPVLGVIENMSQHVCGACGHEEAIFGEGGAAHMVAKYDFPLLGQLPLAKQVREDTDQGQPTVARDPDGKIAQQYRQIALQLVMAIALRPKDYSGKFPNIVVEN